MKTEQTEDNRPTARRNLFDRRLFDSRSEQRQTLTQESLRSHAFRSSSAGKCTHTPTFLKKGCSTAMNRRRAEELSVTGGSGKEVTAEAIVEENAELKLQLLHKAKDFETMTNKLKFTETQNLKLKHKNTHLEQKLASMIMHGNTGFSVDVSQIPVVSKKSISLVGSPERSPEYSFKSPLENMDKELSRASKMSFADVFKTTSEACSKIQTRRGSLKRVSDHFHHANSNLKPAIVLVGQENTQFKQFIKTQRERIGESSQNLTQGLLAWNFGSQSKRKGIQKCFSLGTSRGRLNHATNQETEENPFNKEDAANVKLTNLIFRKDQNSVGYTKHKRGGSKQY